MIGNVYTEKFTGNLIVVYAKTLLWGESAVMVKLSNKKQTPLLLSELRQNYIKVGRL